MEITGKIIEECRSRSGVSAKTGNAWMMQEYVIETTGQYPKRCLFSVFGEEKIKEFNIKLGDMVKVQIDIDAREYNERWYNDIRAWKVEHVSSVNSEGAQQVPNQGKTDDLPF